ncbi:MAG TPA: GAF domain-containing protein, partial [Anaerolineales bacterium]|nr:GAF domain-containing protein [Anaerolineales bacterium]
QLSLALENARLFQETQRRAEELTVLNELGNELSAKLDPKGIADVIYKYTSRLMNTKNFYIALYDEKNDEKSYPLAFEEGLLLDLQPSKVTGRGFTDHIIRNKKVIFAPENVLGHMKALGIDFVPLNEDDTPSQCWLGVPMLIGDRILGVIAVQSVDTANLYDEHDRDILATIASQAAIAAENARLFQEAQRRAQETAALAEVGREISATLNLEIVLERISLYALELLQATSAAAYLPVEGGEKWQAAAAVGLDAVPIKNDFVNRGEGVLGKVVLQHSGTIMNNVNTMPDAITISGTERVDLFEHLMGVPVLSGNRVTGLLAVWRNGDGREFTQTELDFLTSLSLQTAIAIENARLFQETTQRQQAQERSEAELRALFSAMEDVIIVYDKDGRYVRIAPTNPALLFRPPQEMVGKLIHEILPKELHEPFMTTIHKVLAGEENVSIEYPLTLGGATFWFDANVSKLAGDQVFWVARDISERKLSEEALQRRNTYLAVSSEIGRLVTSTLDLNSIFSRTVSLISERFGFYHSAIFIIEETGFNAVLREATGEAGEKMKAQGHSLVVGSNSIVGKAAESGEPMVANDVEHESLHRPNPFLPDTRSEAAIPLRIGIRIVG